jgi:hypothetical protein
MQVYISHAQDDFPCRQLIYVFVTQLPHGSTQLIVSKPIEPQASRQAIRPSQKRAAVRAASEPPSSCMRAVQATSEPPLNCKWAIRAASELSSEASSRKYALHLICLHGYYSSSTPSTRPLFRLSQHHLNHVRGLGITAARHQLPIKKYSGRKSTQLRGARSREIPRINFLRLDCEHPIKVPDHKVLQDWILIT